MRKTERGTFDAKSDGVVSVVKWHDNQCVTVATNYDTIASVGKVRRWSALNRPSSQSSDKKKLCRRVVVCTTDESDVEVHKVQHRYCSSEVGPSD